MKYQRNICQILGTFVQHDFQWTQLLKYNISIVSYTELSWTIPFECVKSFSPTDPSPKKKQDTPNGKRAAELVPNRKGVPQPSMPWYRLDWTQIVPRTDSLPGCQKQLKYCLVCSMLCIGFNHWLVVWNINSFFPYIGNVIIPIDFHIFQRGGPTSNQISYYLRRMARIGIHRHQPNDAENQWALAHCSDITGPPHHEWCFVGVKSLGNTIICVICPDRVDQVGSIIGCFLPVLFWSVGVYICMCMHICCNGDPPWKATTCNMFWYNDFGCWFIDFPFVGISLDFSSGALWQNVLPQDFAANSFVRISSKISLLQLKFDEIWTMILTKFERNFWRFFWRFFLWQNVVAKRFATRQNFVKI